jgi:hypothetical protein
MEKRTPAQKLIDWFSGLTMNVKLMELLIIEHQEGLKDQKDFEERFNAQSWVLAENLKKLKPMSEELIKAGYDKFTNNLTPVDDTDLATI